MKTNDSIEDLKVLLISGLNDIKKRLDGLEDQIELLTNAVREKK